MLFTNPYHLDIKTFWDGKPCKNPSLWGSVELEGTSTGLRITASLPHQTDPRIPEVEEGERVANLWEYDVVECFLVGTEKYLEVELGAGGHFLVLDFTAARVRDREYEDFHPSLEFVSNAGAGRWRSSLTLPWEMVPAGLHAANAFVIVRDHFVCASPLPGPEADFHQPSRFPEIPKPFLS